MEEEKFYKVILRHDTSTNWTINNPILAFGEYGVEDDTHRVKRGNGETPWDSLLYETFGISLADYECSELNFNNAGTDLKSTNVQDVILELYEMIKEGGGSTPEERERIKELESQNDELTTENTGLKEENTEAEKVVDEIIGETNNNESEGE